MDWITNGVRLLGLGVLAVWEYWLFKQRYTSRTGKLRSKQIDGAAAVIKDSTAAFVAAKQWCLPPDSNAVGANHALEVTSTYNAAVNTYRAWLAFLPTDLNDDIARFLQALSAVIAADEQTRRHAFTTVQHSYIAVIVGVRRRLGEAPLNQTTVDILEQLP